MACTGVLLSDLIEVSVRSYERPTDRANPYTYCTAQEKLSYYLRACRLDGWRLLSQ